MSGYNSRFLYDQCTFDQNLVSSINPGKYDLFLDKFENNNTSINSSCKPGQKACTSNKNANIEAKWGSIGLRTDIESDLLSINRPNTRCANLKYFPCGPGCNTKYCDKDCKNYIVVNTIICDRHIVPTNNKMPTTSGF